MRAARVAGRSRGTPRIANNLLRWVRDYAQVKADNHITKAVADQAIRYRPEVVVLAAADNMIFGAEHPRPSRHDIIEQFMAYMEREVRAGTPLKHMTRHVLGLFHGQPGGRKFRRHISENAHRPEATARLVRQAAAFVPDTGF